MIANIFQQSQNRCSRERFLSRHGGRVLLVSGFGQGEICCCNKGKYLELRTLDCELGTTRERGGLSLHLIEIKILLESAD